MIYFILSVVWGWLIGTSEIEAFSFKWWIILAFPHIMVSTFMYVK